MNLKGKFPSTLIIPKPCLKALPLLVGYKNLFLTLKTILCYIVVILSLIMKKNWSPPPNIWNNNSFLKLILCTLVVSTFSVTKDWIIFMIQNIDSFPLEPVLMLKFATDFGFFQCCPLHRNSQLALTVCRMMVTTKIHDIQKLLLNTFAFYWKCLHCHFHTKESVKILYG